MGHDKHFRDKGRAKFYELSVNGESAAVIQAPDSLAAGYNLTLPSALPAGTQLVQLSVAGLISTVADGVAGTFLRTDGAGNFTWAAGTTSLDDAYNNGATIAVDSGPVILNQTSTSPAIQLNQVSTTNLDCVLDIQNSSQCEGIIVSMKSTATNASAGLRVYQTGQGSCVRLEKSNTGGVNVLSVYDSGSGGCALLTQIGEGTALSVAKSSTDGLSAVTFTNSGSGTTLTLAPKGSGVGLSVSKSAGVAGTCINVSNSGTSVGISVVQSGANNAIQINQASSKSAGGGIAVTTNNTSGTADCLYLTANGSGNGVQVYLPADGPNGVYIRKTNTTGVGAVGNCLKIDNSSGANTIEISNIGAGYDIYGSGGTWSITPAGVATFAGLGVPKAAQVQNTTVTMVSTSTSYENRGTISVTVPSAGTTSVRLASWTQITPSTSGSSADFYSRIKRDGSIIAYGTIEQDNGDGGARIGLEWIDINPGAGAHSYTYEIRAVSNNVRHEHSEFIGVLVNCTGTSC